MARPYRGRGRGGFVPRPRDSDNGNGGYVPYWKRRGGGGGESSSSRGGYRPSHRGSLSPTRFPRHGRRGGRGGAPPPKYSDQHPQSPVYNNSKKKSPSPIPSPDLSPSEKMRISFTPSPLRDSSPPKKRPRPLPEYSDERPNGIDKDDNNNNNNKSASPTPPKDKVQPTKFKRVFEKKMSFKIPGVTKNGGEEEEKPRTNVIMTNEPNTESLYERVAQVGEGTYGKVYKAINRESGKMVALKRIRMESEREGFPITAMREIKLLQSLKHENIIQLYEMLVERGSVYMVFEYMDHDLTGILTHPKFRLNQGEIKGIFHQFCRGLAYLHKCGILHRDIKASNILLSRDGTIKLADFGLARFFDKHNKMKDYTNRVITLWYRPPELLLGATNYGPPVDVWGAGCLFGELFTRRALFTGDNEITQLQSIYNIRGTPTSESWPDASKLPWYQLIRPKNPLPDRLKEEALNNSDITLMGLDLLQRLLVLNPNDRITANDALNHPYFTQEKPKPIFNFNLEGEWHEFESRKRRRKEREQQQQQQQLEKSNDIGVAGGGGG